MSRVYFHSPSGEAELRGSERAWAGNLTMRLGHAPIDGLSRDFWTPLIPSDHSYLHSVPDHQWMSAFDTAWRVAWELKLRVGDVELDPFTLSLNSAVAMGSDPMVFLARMHGTCEIHGWVDGKCRPWLADIIRQGQESGLMRKEQGWEDVHALLLKSVAEPVVMSYSVCDQFPNAHASDWMEWPEGVPKNWDALTDGQQQEYEEREEAWYALPTDEKWERGMRWLRTSDEAGAELTPEMWRTSLYGNGWSSVDLYERINRYGHE